MSRKQGNDTYLGMKKPYFSYDGNRKYIAFNKPFGVLSQFTSNDLQKRTLSEFSFPKDVYSVGRLDEDSEGLLILSDDVRLNDCLLNPIHAHKRTYISQVEGEPNPQQLAHIASGVMIKGKKTLPVQVRWLTSEPLLPPRSKPIRQRKFIPTSFLQLQICEGKNRQVRKMTASVGLPTLRLIRVAIGRLTLSDLQLEPGSWKYLTKTQVLSLFD